MFIYFLFLWTSLIKADFVNDCCGEKLECRANYPSLAVDNVFRIVTLNTQKWPQIAVVFKDFASVVTIDDNYRGNIDVITNKPKMSRFQENEHVWGYSRFFSKHTSSFEFLAGFSMDYSYHLNPSAYTAVINVNESKNIHRFFGSNNILEYSSHIEVDTNCNTATPLHVAFCQEEPLMDIVVVPLLPEAENTDNDDTLVTTSPFAIIGYYGKKIVSQSNLKREYTVKSWMYKTNETFHEDFVVNGYLTAVEIYKATNDMIHGLYFTTDGNACFFEQSYENLQRGSINFEEIGLTRKPCRSFQEFLGCRRPFCFDPRFDASFTLETPTSKQLYFIANNHIFYSEKTNGGNKLVSVDPFKYAVKLVQAKEGKCPNNIYNLCYIPKYTMSTFTVTLNDPSVKASVINLLREDVKKYYYIRSASGNMFFDYGEYENLDNNQLSDAAWYNSAEKKVYLFHRQDWTSFYLTFDAAERPFQLHWTWNETGTLHQFGIDETNIDAVTVIDKKGYFFVNGWFYVIEEMNVFKKRRGKRLSLTDFFDTRSLCYKNDKKSLQQLIERYNVWKRKPVNVATDDSEMDYADDEFDSPLKWKMGRKEKISSNAVSTVPCYLSIFIMIAFISRANLF